MVPAPSLSLHRCSFDRLQAVRIQLSITIDHWQLPNDPERNYYVALLFDDDIGLDCWMEIGKTEGKKITNGSAKFGKTIEIEYIPQERQSISFQIFDQDNSKKVAETSATLTEIICANLFGPFEKRVYDNQAGCDIGQDVCNLQISTQEMPGYLQNSLLQFKAENVPVKLFKKHLYFFELHIVHADSELELVHRSNDEESKKSLVWESFTVSLLRLTAASKIRFSLWRKKRNGVHVKLITFFDTTHDQLMTKAKFNVDKGCVISLSQLSKNASLSLSDLANLK